MIIMNNNNTSHRSDNPLSNSIGSIDKDGLMMSEGKIECESFDWDRADLTMAQASHHQEKKPSAKTASSTMELTEISSLNNQFPNELGWGEHDVPQGREQKVREHIGCVRFRALIEHYRPRYLQAAHRSEKSHISGIVYRIITEKGGRFLEKVVVEGTPEVYMEIPQDKALAKISQFLRTGTRPVRRHMQALFRKQELERLNQVESQRQTTASTTLSHQQGTATTSLVEASSLTAAKRQGTIQGARQEGIMAVQQRANPSDVNLPAAVNQSSAVAGQQQAPDKKQQQDDAQGHQRQNSSDWWAFDDSLQL